MKKTLFLITLLACCLFVASGAIAYLPDSGVPGSPHDLTTGGSDFPSQSDTLNRICIFCHTPHNAYRLNAANSGLPGGGPQAPDAYTYLPLWNHLLPSADPTYALYYNGPGEPQSYTDPKSAQSIVLMSGQTAPGGTSLLCLSCHDGSISVNSYGNNTSQPPSVQSYISNNGTIIGAGYIIGQSMNLQNHHPVGFNYNTVQSIDTAIALATAVDFNSGDPVSNHLYGAGNTMMECGTCHSVHNTGNSGETLLWRSDGNSALCLTCHIKGPLPSPGTITDNMGR